MDCNFPLFDPFMGLSVNIVFTIGHFFYKYDSVLLLDYNGCGLVFGCGARSPEHWP